MKWLLCNISLLLLVTASLVQGLAKEQYPRIGDNPQGCWKYSSEVPSGLHICDPDKIVSESQAKQLHAAAEEIRNLRSCLCGEYVCRTERLRGRDHAYMVTIALVRSMDVNGGNGNMVTAAENYSVYLRNERGYGALALCQDDIIIFLAYEERALYILTGNMAMNVVTNAEVADIIDDSKSHFSTQIYDGIDYILSRIKAEILK